MNDQKKLLAWMSDHRPSKAQIANLDESGFEVLHIPSPQPNRWGSVQQAFTTMMRKCNGLPDAIVMILPSATMGGMFLKMAKDIPVYRPDVRKEDGRIVWTGKWLKITGTAYKYDVIERI